MLRKETKIKKHGNTTAVVIPTLVRNDSQFPFKLDEQVMVEIDNDRLIIRRVDKCDQ